MIELVSHEISREFTSKPNKLLLTKPCGRDFLEAVESIQKNLERTGRALAELEITIQTAKETRSFSGNDAVQQAFASKIWRKMESAQGHITRDNSPRSSIKDDLKIQFSDNKVSVFGTLCAPKIERVDNCRLRETYEGQIFEDLQM